MPRALIIGGAGFIRSKVYDAFAESATMIAILDGSLPVKAILPTPTFGWVTSAADTIEGRRGQGKIILNGSSLRLT
jgi:hypothetical protein